MRALVLRNNYMITYNVFFREILLLSQLTI